MTPPAFAFTRLTQKEPQNAPFYLVLLKWKKGLAMKNKNLRNNAPPAGLSFRALRTFRGREKKAW